MTEHEDPRPRMRASVNPEYLAAAERFLKKTRFDPLSGCLIWTGARTGAGYGSVRHDSKVKGAHQVSYGLFNEACPRNGPVLRHSCDNPLCVHPRHLTAGTHAENAEDMMERGRKAIPDLPLTSTEVAAVRDMYAARDRHPQFTKHGIAAAMSVTLYAIRKALAGAG